MTDNTPAVPWWQANQIAEEFVKSIADCTEKVVIAGSIRRKCPYVHDIDILAISKTAQETVTGWFLTETVTHSLLHQRIAMLGSSGIATPRVKKDGKTMVGDMVAFLNYKGMPLDLYYASEATFSGLTLMRTGSARHNTMLATLAIKQGKRFHADGYGISKDGKRLDDGLTEESIFAALDLKYLPPENRS